MPILSLSLDSLKELDNGIVGAMLEKVFHDFCQEIEDRGNDCKPRKLVITITAQKDRPEGSVVSQVEADLKRPAIRSGPTVHQVYFGADGPQLLFSAHAADNPQQLTIDDFDTKTTQRKESEND